MEHKNRNQDVNDILDDEYFYEHYGKPPVRRRNRQISPGAGIAMIIIGCILWIISPILGIIFYALILFPPLG